MDPCIALTGTPAQTYAAFINTLMAAQCALYAPQTYPSDNGPNLKDGDEFDFIVVGGGSAGSVLVNKLARVSNWTVLLLEAGGYPSGTTEIPNLSTTLAQGNEDWGFQTEPSETSCLGMKGQVCPSSRGKVLGGSSNLNGMLYLRGNRKDYDEWAANGNQYWNYDIILTYYKRIEGFQGNDENMGTGGPLKITKYVNDNSVREALKKAYEESGYGPYSEENPQGYYDAPTTIYDGTRQSAAKAFLKGVKGQKNAYVAVNAHVTKVLFDSNLKVEGVQVRVNDKLIKVKATTEVVLSTGPVNSPQILMNSGIGSKKHLKQLGIPVVKDLKVGENLLDHAVFFGLMMNIAPDALPQKTGDDVMDDWYQYLKYRKGALSKSGFENFLLFFNTKNSSNYPNLKMSYFVVHQNDPEGFLKEFQRAYNLPAEVVKIQNENNKKSHNIIFMPELTYPKSVGKVQLRSSDPFDKPKIFANYFSDDEDVNTILEGIRFYQEVAKSKAFAPLKPEFVHLDLVNCRSFEQDSDDYWKCAIRNIGTGISHLAGTNRMGPATDPTTVVDYKARVHGVQGLRVADASIIPNMISADIHTAAIMIGQKLSETIRIDYGYDEELP